MSTAQLEVSTYEIRASGAPEWIGFDREQFNLPDLPVVAELGDLATGEESNSPQLRQVSDQGKSAGFTGPHFEESGVDLNQRNSKVLAATLMSLALLVSACNHDEKSTGRPVTTCEALKEEKDSTPLFSKERLQKMREYRVRCIGGGDSTSDRPAGKSGGGSLCERLRAQEAAAPLLSGERAEALRKIRQNDCP